MSYTQQFMAEATQILAQLDVNAIDRVVTELADLRARGGRLFVLGCGGGAGHASHAVCDFRKIASIEAYAPTDNVSELTARVNDDGWETSYVNWLKGSHLSSHDALFILSVGGGDLERNVSPNLVRSLEYARQVGATVCGVVGRDGGYTAQVADACVVIPTANPETVTSHTESFQAMVWHLLVSHPALRATAMKWESLTMRRAVFLDRDGVLNRAFIHDDGKSHPPASPGELEILPGVAKACTALRQAGFLLIVVTNQPDVARGTQHRDVVEDINDALRRQVPIDDIRVCYHDDADDCACRKPRPGLLLEAASAWEIDLANSFMVGDCWKDIEAGRQAGCKTVLIKCAYSEAGRCHPDFQATLLQEATDWILKHDKLTRGAEERESKNLSDLRVKIFADGADRACMLEMYANPLIKGFTTNPTLMRRAGVRDYRTFAHQIIEAIPDRPLSFEVLSDEFDEMERQALEISSWGENVYVKIPVTNTRQQPSYDLLCRLARAGVKVNVTALMTLDQVRESSRCLAEAPSSIVSIFAGRVADTGRDPVTLMAAAVELLRPYPNLELLWASPRELLNVFQADAVGCHIITVTHDILRKLYLVGKDLHEYSLDTVKMFYNDAQQAGYSLGAEAIAARQQAYARSVSSVGTELHAGGW